MSVCTLLMKNGSERKIYIDDDYFDDGYEYNDENGYLIIEGCSDCHASELIAKIKLSAIVGYYFE